MTLTAQILLVTARYCEARRLSVARLSTILFNNGKRLGEISRGGDIRTRVFERAMQWLSSHWPDGAEWPPEVPRPACNLGPTVSMPVQPITGTELAPLP